MWKLLHLIFHLLLTTFTSTLGKCSATYLTVGGRSDGFGGQLHGQLSCLLMSKMLPNCTYAHSPLQKIEHINNPGDDWEKVHQIEAFMNLGYDEIPISQVPGDEVVDTRAYCHEYTEANLQLYDLLKGELLRKFAANKRLIKAGRKVTGSFTVDVHVHVRRGDVAPDHPRFMSVGKYHDILTAIKKGLGVHGISIDVHIHSEGDQSEFEKLVEDFDAVLHLDEDVLQTWHAMAVAQVLVLSQSSLSYTAGLYNQGVVVFSEPRFFHGPVPSWYVYNSDPDKLQERFAEHRTRDILRHRVQNARRISFAGIISPISRFKDVE
jgi:hypothetical protein